MHRVGHKWSEEQLTELYDMWKVQGLSGGKIAELLGRTRGAVMGKIFHRPEMKRGSPRVNIDINNTMRLSVVRQRGSKSKSFHKDSDYIEPYAEYAARKRRERQEAKDAD